VEAEQIIIEKDNTAQGIVDLIRENGVTELVMGAAADRRYSR
jgi:K+-sensing histidine kinase KdpD